MTSRAKIIALTPLVLAAGCAGPLNNEIGLGNQGRVDGRGVWTPPTLGSSLIVPPREGFEPSTNPKLAPVYAAGGPVAPEEAKPSISGIERTWAEVPVLVPNDLPAHQPRMTWSHVEGDTPRARGVYPTAQSALTLGSSRQNDAQVKEAILAPLVAASDVVLGLPRFFAQHRPGRPTRTVAWPYERTPRREALEIDPVAPVPGSSAEPSTPAKDSKPTAPAAAEPGV